MLKSWRAATLAIVFALLALGLAAGRDPAAYTVAPPGDTPMPAPVAPTATPAIVRLPDDVRIAGVEVGGLPPGEARQKVGAALAPLLLPLIMQSRTAQSTLRPETIGLRLELDSLIDEALAVGAGARVGLRISYDLDRLRVLIEQLARDSAAPPRISLIGEAGAPGRQFVIRPGEQVDVDTALVEIDQRLRAPGSPRRITLPLRPVQPSGLIARPDADQLNVEVGALAQRWPGVAGIYVYDLATEHELASINPDTVFSAASVMKAAILLYAYIQLPVFNEEQEGWLQQMIADSNNLAANQLLAASVGGNSIADAAHAAQQLSAMLRSMGLRHSYINSPYDDEQNPIVMDGIRVPSGPAFEGPEPHTVADPYLRTTPAEMARIFLWIEQCRQGRGPLLEHFAGTLGSARCGEMIAWLNQSRDQTRMVAGLPEGARIAHKGGWITDLDAEVGIVRRAGGDFLLATFLYHDARQFDRDQAIETIAGITRLVYSYYNPILPTDAGDATGQQRMQPAPAARPNAEHPDAYTRKD